VGTVNVEEKEKLVRLGGGGEREEKGDESSRWKRNLREDHAKYQACVHSKGRPI